MSVRHASAKWQGSLEKGTGRIQFSDKTFDQPYSFSSRFEEGEGTNPEELIGAAHAGCYSMALAHALSEAGHEPKDISTKADVELAKKKDGFSISTVELHVEAEVPGIDEETFQARAEEAKTACPVSQALKGVEIKLDAKLKS